jgi:hypothetical protein
MAAIDITGAGGGITSITGTSPVVITNVGVSGRNVALDQTQFKTINGNSIFGAGNIVIGLTNWIEAYTSNPVGNTSSFTALGAGTNINAAIIPKGTGAIVADIADGAATGGNARGSYAVDLQMNRSAANQVASGTRTVIAGGINNRNNGTDSVICGGSDNINTAYTSFIGAGLQNQAQKDFSVVGGGILNNCNSLYGSIPGGYANTTTNGDFIFCVGGFNTVSGNGSTSAGGAGISITSNYGSNLGGDTNTITGAYATNGGGRLNTVAGDYASNLGGYYANAYLYGQRTIANGRFTITGDAQGSEAILRLNSGFTDAQTKEIYLDGSSLRITGPTNSAMTVNIDIVAIVTAISGTATGVTVGDMFSQNSLCAYKNLAGTGSIVGTPYSIHKLHDASMTACDTTFTVTGAALQVNFLGPNFAGGGTVTLRVVAKARIVETRY